MKYLSGPLAETDMTDSESRYDKLLKINTSGRDDTRSDEYRYPYEPTPYSVLERIAESGLFGENDTVLDYGCGKGRVGIFLSHRTRAKSIGIEYDERILLCAQENKRSSGIGDRAEFILSRAEEYAVPDNVSRCYFFNPFSAELLHKVLARITDSYYSCPREILLFFYYPSDEYISCLMTASELDFYGEIDCRDIFSPSASSLTADMRERVCIFGMGGAYK